MAALKILTIHIPLYSGNIKCRMRIIMEVAFAELNGEQVAEQNLCLIYYGVFTKLTSRGKTADDK